MPPADGHAGRALVRELQLASTRLRSERRMPYQRTLPYVDPKRPRASRAKRRARLKSRQSIGPCNHLGMREWWGQRRDGLLDAVFAYLLLRWGIPLVLALLILSLSSLVATFALVFAVIVVLYAQIKKMPLSLLSFPVSP